MHSQSKTGLNSSMWVLSPLDDTLKNDKVLAGFELKTSGLPIPHSDHSATTSPCCEGVSVYVSVCIVLFVCVFGYLLVETITIFIEDNIKNVELILLVEYSRRGTEMVKLDQKLKLLQTGASRAS